MRRVRRKIERAGSKARGAHDLLQRPKRVRRPDVRKIPQSGGTAPDQALRSIPERDRGTGGGEARLTGRVQMNGAEPGKIPADILSAAASAPAADPGVLHVQTGARDWKAEARSIVEIVASLGHVFPSVRAIYTAEVVEDL